MEQVDPKSKRRSLWATLAVAAATGASAMTIALPATAYADPPPGTPDTNAPVPGEAPPGQVPAPEPPRTDNAAGGFSFVMPPGWVEGDAAQLSYGSALLSKEVGPGLPGQAPVVANDTRILLGRLDHKLYAAEEADNGKAATKLASDMGQFYMPYPGTRVNSENTDLTGGELGGKASFYEVKFTDETKPNGQVWAGVVGKAGADDASSNRWFVVWLGTSNDPIDKGAATALAESIRPFTPPAPEGQPPPEGQQPPPGQNPPPEGQQPPPEGQNPPPGTPA